MALSSQPYKGTRDFYPEDMRLRNWMFGVMRRVARSYGFQEYDGPMLEPFGLYAAKTGEEIVNQQLYSLVDRGERKLAIRPEMTPTLARMVAAKVNELPKPVRWFSIPNLWRYERPQRGRLREHWQLNVDILGGDPLLADAEILAVALELVAQFGGEKHVSVRVNNRKLMDHFFSKRLGLGADAGLRVAKAIDARAKIGEEAYLKWLGELGLDAARIAALQRFFHSSLEEVAAELPCEGTAELRALFTRLEESGTAAQARFDPTVMRGLDYYTGTVFEMYDFSPENPRAMFGGGRYDNLIGLFGNAKLSGVGLGMGDVTLQNFLETHGLVPPLEAPVDVFVTLPEASLRGTAERLARELRTAGLRVMTPLGADGFGVQLKLASRHGAAIAVLLGERELAAGRAAFKVLATGVQREAPLGDLAREIARELATRANSDRLVSS